ncbi:synaptic plasticity regulator PANTS-like isoform X2 [Branchiostoma floridae x Branchiostoma japonicum]
MSIFVSLFKPYYPCDYYKQEYSDCTTVGHRFHSYYVYGEKPECGQWKKDYEACTAWMKTKSEEAKQELLKVEDRHLQQKYYVNPVWPRRVTPPKDWYLPVEEMRQKQKLQQQS